MAHTTQVRATYTHLLPLQRRPNGHKSLAKATQPTSTHMPSDEYCACITVYDALSQSLMK
jgi:hypothetical protein